MSQRSAYTVEGRVQGVNFRNFTARQAKQIGLTGFVQNASDGTVIGEAQGDESSLKEFIDHLHQGPPASRVAAVNHKQIDLKQYETGFGVHR